MKIVDQSFIPVPTQSAHASTIAFYKGSPVVSWFGGFQEGDPSCAIYVWSAANPDSQTIIGDKDQMPRWNPILFPYEDKLYLFTKAGIFCDRWQTFVYELDEDMNIVKSPQLLPAGLNGPVKTKPIFHNYFVYCGSSVETAFDWTSYIERYKVEDGEFRLFDRSLPLTAEKLKMSGFNNRLTNGIIQPSLWVDDEEMMHAFFRASRGLGYIYYSKRELVHNEFVWTPPAPTKLRNPNSGVDTVFYDGRLFLVYNPSTEMRAPLSVVELDKDFNIIDTLVIREKVESNDITISGELSYPYMIEQNGQLHLTYTYGRSKIEYVVIDIEEK